MSFDQQILKLSNAFESASENLELIVHAYNLGDGKSETLKQKCSAIKEYSIFSNKYKFYRKQKFTIDQAVKEAIRYCLEHNVMTEYLRNNEKEVIDMFGFEWNEKEEKDALIKVGEARGEARGEIRGTLRAIKNLMRTTNLSAEAAMKAIGISPSEYKNYLMML